MERAEPLKATRSERSVAFSRFLYGLLSTHSRFHIDQEMHLKRLRTDNRYVCEPYN